MTLNRQFYTIIFTLLVISFSACNDGDNSLPASNAGNNIDLFKANNLHNSPAQTALFLPADSAYKNSFCVVNASSISLADSSFNRTTKDNFYLYSFLVDSTLKGNLITKHSKVYFIAYLKINPQVLKQYRLYLVPFPNHTIIKNSLHINWQWLNKAPFLENLFIKT